MADRAGPKTSPQRGRSFRSGTSRGAHIFALYHAISELTELARFAFPEQVQKHRALSAHRAALERAYPELLKVYETDISQWLAEEDGDAIEEIP